MSRTFFRTRRTSTDEKFGVVKFKKKCVNDENISIL